MHHVRPGALKDRQMEVISETLQQMFDGQPAKYVELVLMPEAIVRLHAKFVDGLGENRDAETYMNGGSLVDLEFVPFSKEDTAHMFRLLQYAEEEMTRIELCYFT